MPLIYKGLWIKWKKTLKKTENIFLIPKKVLSLEGGKQTTTLRQTIMNYLEFSKEAQNLLTVTMSKVEMQLAYVIYTNFDISIIECVSIAISSNLSSGFKNSLVQSI